MSELPISNIINVSITNTPSGASEKNVNSIALFSNEATSSLNAYEIAIAPSQVADFYGTNSLTYRMANAMFAQSPNIRTGNGRLVVIPMQAAVSATPGSFTSTNISANLTAIIAVTAGDLRVTVDATNYDLTNMNFTNCTTFADVAAVVQGKLVDATVTAISNGIKIESKKVGTASTIALAAVPSGTGIAMNGSGYFNAAGGTTATGANSTGETIEAAVARMEGAVGFVGVLTTVSIEDSKVLTAANYFQGKDMLFHYAGASIKDIAGISTTITNAGDTHTRFKMFSAGIEAAKLENAAYVGRGHSVNFSGSATSQTMNLKQLATISPDLGVSQTLYSNADAAGCDLYVSYEGVSGVYSTGGNDYFDNVYSDLALKFALQTAGFNFLRQTNTKVPQTESGMNGLKGAYSVVLDRFVRNGCVAPGSWQSSERFGDPVIFDNNIATVGWYVYSLPIVQQNQVEREGRKAPLVQIAVKRAGAIHTSDVIVLIND